MLPGMSRPLAIKVSAFTVLNRACSSKETRPSPPLFEGFRSRWWLSAQFVLQTLESCGLSARLSCSQHKGFRFFCGDDVQFLAAFMRFPDDGHQHERVVKSAMRA
ncbi:conserved hypothetical protein [Trichinella spiralis]|uniref:hypothetical protein n=1 Tax=Trichinella spiralis TaxID=6334 RepID=UPI0001EFDAC1|nr:conserved hypothetical protein [Trichinella spiralis]